MRRLVLILGFTSALLNPLRGFAVQQRPTLAVQGGLATGSGSHFAFAFDLGIPVIHPLVLVASIVFLTETPSACEQVWPSSYRCSLRGTFLMVGPEVSTSISSRLRGAAAVQAGFFHHRDNTFRTNPPAVNAMAELRLHLGRGWHLAGSYRMVRVFDDDYRDLLGERLRFGVPLFGFGRQI
jgi:hypothetical protein